MSRCQIDSLFGEMDSRLRGNDMKGSNGKEVVCSHIIRVAFKE